MLAAEIMYSQQLMFYCIWKLEQQQVHPGMEAGKTQVRTEM